MKIIVTNHALKRFAERFRLYFPKSCFFNNRDIESLIFAQLKFAVKQNEWKMSPFHVNAMAWKHGPNIEVYYRNPVYYITQDSNGKRTILTVVKRFPK